MTQLQIVYTDSKWKIFLLVGDDAILVTSSVIIVIGNLITIRFPDDAGTAVKVDGIRAVFVDDLKYLVTPGCIELVIRITIWQVTVCLEWKSRTIVNLVLWLVDIGFIVGRHKPAPQPLMVEGSNQLNIMLTKGFCAFAKDIAMRTAVHTVDGIYIAVPHGKVVGMFGDRTGIAGATFFNKVGPFLRVKGFALHHWNKILVAKIMQGAEVLFVVSVLLQSFAIHISGIPFILAGWDTVWSPMEEKSKFCVLKPLRSWLLYR